MAGGHGGKRPKSGRKSYAISEKEEKKLLSAMRRCEKETGQSVWDILMNFVYGKHKYPNMRLAAIKLLGEWLFVKRQHKTVEEHKYDHRVVELPTIKRPKEDEIAQA